MQKSLRRLSPLLIAVIALGLVVAGCGGGDDDESTSDGAAPTSTEADEAADDEAADDEAPDDESTDPYAQAIQQQAAALGVSSLRVEGDGTNVLVMSDGSTAAEIGPACEYAKTILPQGTPISTDLAGVVAPCP